MMGFRLAPLFALTGAVACAPANLGQSPDILWWTDHETGDFSDWDTGGYHWTVEGGSLDIASSPLPTRSGTHSIRSSVTSPGTSVQSGAAASRNDALPVEAYYSAWFYFPEAVTSTTYWLFSKFRSRTKASDSSTIVNAWDLDVMTNDSGALSFALYHHANSERRDTTVGVPIARWFQVESFLRATNDATGKLTVWIDGIQAFDVSSQATMPSSYVEWSVGGIAEVISPNPITMYVDDAAVSTQRLGPDYPVFWRGH